MIKVVVIKLSPELTRTISKCSKQDETLQEIAGNWAFDSHDGFTLAVTAQEAADWCKSWFDEVSLRMIVEDNDWLYVEYPACCDDPLIKSFVETVLKIYQLTLSV